MHVFHKQEIDINRSINVGMMFSEKVCFRFRFLFLSKAAHYEYDFQRRRLLV